VVEREAGDLCSGGGDGWSKANKVNREGIDKERQGNKEEGEK